ncbi:MAG: hypothetical protein IJ327_07385 [Lachnospiraceae bacterium]|nr:hypothetical protein [Lachnospiraceae bacterium]
MKSSKKKSCHGNLIAFIIFLALGITGVYLSFPSLQMLLTGPQALDTFDYSAVKEAGFDHEYVSGAISGIYDYYCDEIRDDSLYAREYLIDGGDYYYLGLRVKKADLEPAETLLSASMDYLKGVDDGTALEKAKYTVTGTIKPMDSESISILQEYLDYDTMDQTTRDTILFCYLDVGSIGAYNMPTIVTLLIFTVIFWALALWFLIRFFAGRSKKKVRSQR